MKHRRSEQRSQPRCFVRRDNAAGVTEVDRSVVNGTLDAGNDWPREVAPRRPIFFRTAMTVSAATFGATTKVAPVKRAGPEKQLIFRL